MNTIKTKKNLLFCPGPVNISHNILSAMVHQIGHREKEFSELLNSINNRLLKLYQIKQTNRYYPVLITGSGTVANEAVLSSVVDKKHILIITNGEFGDRLHTISKLHNKHTHRLGFAWGEKINIAKVEAYLQKHPIDIIAMVHHETSTGMLNPVDQVGVLVQKYNKMFIIDTVSSASAEKIDLEAWNVTFCTTSSGKAIGSLPGLGIIIGKKESFENLKDIPAKTIYMNLYKLYYYSNTLKQTPNTPAIQLFYALDQALENILKIGVQKWRNRIHQRAITLRNGMKKVNLSFLLAEEDMAACLTTVIVPENIAVSLLKKKLKEKNIVIYEGKGPLLGKVFQVGNIGELNKRHIFFFLKLLKEAIQNLNTVKGKPQASKFTATPFQQYIPILLQEKVRRIPTV